MAIRIRSLEMSRLLPAWKFKSSFCQYSLLHHVIVGLCSHNDTASSSLSMGTEMHAIEVFGMYAIEVVRTVRTRYSAHRLIGLQNSYVKFI